MPTADSWPDGITAGPDGALWFTEWNANKIGRITTAGAITEYGVPSYAQARPSGIAAGPDGALWFTAVPNNIGRITTAGVITLYPVRMHYSNGIIAGSDGALWFVLDEDIARAPACGLGFTASFASGTLTMNFNLGIDTPATFNIVLLNSTGRFPPPFSKAIPAVVPPQAFTLNWNSFPNLGTITVRPELGSGPGPGFCAEQTTVNTAP